MMKKELNELLDYTQPSSYIVSSERYSDNFETPVLTAGQSFILGYTDDKEGIYPASVDNPIILFDDFTTASQWVDFPFKVKSSACKILTPKTNCRIRYLYYAMKNIAFDSTQHKRYWISEYSKCHVNCYDTKTENNIVEELDSLSKAIDLKKVQLIELDSLIKSRFIGQEVTA